MRKLFVFMLTLLSAVGGVLTANAGFRIPYKSSGYWTAFNGTVPDALQTVINDHNGASHTATPPSTTSTTGTLHYHSCPVTVTADGEITITFTYDNGRKMLYIMGVELVQGGEVRYSNYHLGSSGSANSNNEYPLGTVAAGDYDARFYVCNDSGDDHPLSGSNGFVTFDGDVSLQNSTPSPLTTSKLIRINNVERSANKLTLDGSALNTKPGVSDDDPNAYWALELADDGKKYYLRNCIANKYVKNSTTDSDPWSLSETSYACSIEKYVEAYAGDPARFVFNFGSDKDYMHDPGHNTKVVRWLVWEDEHYRRASMWTISETEYNVNTEFVKITYNYKLNGTKYATETKYVVKGASYPEVSNNLAYGIVATKPEGEVSMDEAIDINLDVDLPFQTFNDYNSITQWYYLNIRDDGPTYLKYEKGVDYIKATDAKSVIDASSDDERDAYSWGFIGNNPYAMKIVNKKSGKTMILSSPEAPTGNQNAGQIARMVEESGAAGNTTWTLQKPTHANPATGAFYIQHPTATRYAFNRQSIKNVGNTLCYWDNRDTGSAIQVVKRPSLKEEMDELIAMAEAQAARVGTTVGMLTQASYNNLSAAVATAKTVNPVTRGDITTLQNAYNSLEIVQPDPQKYYEIVCPRRANKKIYIGNDGNMYFADLTGKLSTVFKFEDAGEGKFYLKGIERGTYMNSSKGHGYGQETATGENASTKVSVTSMNVGDVVSITPQGGAMIHAQENYSQVVGWNNESPTEASAWRIVEVGDIDITERSYTVAVTGAQWATMMLGCSVTIPDDVVAYAVTEAETTAKLKKVTGSIPANYGILINASAGNYDFKFASSATVIEPSILSGTTWTQNVTPEPGKTCYVLAVNDGIVGFYKAALNQNGTSFVNNANKAYLSLTTGSDPTPARFLTFDFDDNAETGINAVEIEEAAPANAAIYDLSGRRVQNAKSGLYIINGKKVIK